MPLNIYNNVNYEEYNGYRLVNPMLAIIDYLNIITNPMSAWEIKFEKRLSRLNYLNLLYKFP